MKKLSFLILFFLIALMSSYAVIIPQPLLKATINDMPLIDIPDPAQISTYSKTQIDAKDKVLQDQVTINNSKPTADEIVKWKGVTQNWIMLDVKGGGNIMLNVNYTKVADIDLKTTFSIDWCRLNTAQGCTYIAGEGIGFVSKMKISTEAPLEFFGSNLPVPIGKVPIIITITCNLKGLRLYADSTTMTDNGDYTYTCIISRDRDSWTIHPYFRANPEFTISHVKFSYVCTKLEPLLIGNYINPALIKEK